MDAESLAQLPVVQNGQVYDIIKNNPCVSGDCTTANDWFESRLAEPDVLLEDLINVITPEAHPVMLLLFNLTVREWAACDLPRSLVACLMLVYRY
jgi:hypothetical protein